MDECVNHTCSNGGSCVDGVNNYSCKCIPGFTGDRCQTGAFVKNYQIIDTFCSPLSLIVCFFVSFLVCFKLNIKQ